MLKIEKLAPEQEALLMRRRAEWAEVATKTEPADRPRAEGVISSLYEEKGLPPPRVIWVDAPLSGELLLSLPNRKRGSLKSRLKATFEEGLADWPGVPLERGIEGRLRKALRSSLVDLLRRT